MESKNQQSYEEEWQKAFKNASMPPPQYLWDKIEHELDEEKRRRPFLLILRPSQWAVGMAAALLIVMGGIFYFNENKPNEIADNQEIINNSKNSDNSKNSNKNINTENIVKPNNTEIISDSKIKINSENTDNTILNEKNINSGNIIKNGNIENSKIIENSIKNANTQFAELKKIAFSEKTNSQKTENQVIGNQNIVLESADNQIISKNLVANFNEIDKKGFHKYGNRFVRRNALFFDFPQETYDKKLIPNDSKFWIGLQSGGGNFNPNMQLGGLNAVAETQADAFATANDPNKAGTSPQLPAGSATNLNNKVLVTQPKNAIQSGFAINSGVSFGYKVSKKWHLESGLRYLRGNTTLQSNTFALQEANGYANIFLADYLAQKGANYTQNANAIVADATQVNNRYEYLMIPIQASYGIGLTKKIRLDVLAGLSTDIFLNNVIQSDQTNFIRETSFNAQSNTYKPLNISGLGGVRANYLLGKHWQATVGTSYQQALFSGISSATNLKMQMRLFGVNYGVNYRF